VWALCLQEWMALERQFERSPPLCVSTQLIAEFLGAYTRPKDSNTSDTSHTRDADDADNAADGTSPAPPEYLDDDEGEDFTNLMQQLDRLEQHH
jgi:hypothetical protein